MTTINDPTPEDLALRPKDLSSLAKPVSPKRDKKRRRQDFLRGPVPIAWIGKATSLGWKATQVALAIYFVAGLKKGQADLPLSTVTCRRFGLTRGGKLVGLKALEEAELIRVQRTHGKNPQVTILPCSDVEEK
jgi:hypothetical protein